MGSDIAAKRKDTGKIYLENGLPVFVGELMGGVSALDAATVQ